MPNNTITSTGVYYWVCPNGVTEVQVEVRAGGGGGGSNNRVGNNAGGGGGGGGYSRSNVAVTPGTNYRGNVGGGGAGGINNNNGANGANSDFNNLAVLARYGIMGLRAGTGGAVSGLGTGDVRYQGGAGAGRTATNNSGGGGAGAGNGANGNSATTAVGATGGLGGGNGGNGCNSLNSNGNNGETAGGGGAGAGPGTLNTKHGGRGANGTVVITWADVPVTVEADLLAGYGKQEGVTTGTGVTAAPDAVQSVGALYNDGITSIAVVVEQSEILAARGTVPEVTIPVYPDTIIILDCLDGRGVAEEFSASATQLLSLDALEAVAVQQDAVSSMGTTTAADLLAGVVSQLEMVGSAGRIVPIDLLAATGIQPAPVTSCGVTVEMDLLVALAEQFGSPTTSVGQTVEQITVPAIRVVAEVPQAGGLQIEIVELEVLAALGAPFVPDAVFPLECLAGVASVTEPTERIDTVLENVLYHTGKAWVEAEGPTVEIVPIPPFVDVGFDEPLYGKAELFGELVGTDITLEPQSAHEAAAVLYDPTVDAQSPGGGEMGLLQANASLQDPTVTGDALVELDALAGAGSMPAATVSFGRIEIVTMEVLGCSAWVGFDVILNSLIAMDAMEAVSEVSDPVFTSLTENFCEELVGAGALPEPTVTAAANAELAALSGRAVIFDPGTGGDALVAADLLDARGAVYDLGEFAAVDIALSLAGLTAKTDLPRMVVILKVIAGRMKVEATAKDPSVSATSKEPSMTVTAQ